MDVLILRLDAPLMSFGAPIIDEYGKVQSYPALSLIVGLLSNALGYDHSDFDELESLQKRLQYASRQDRAGQQIQDFQAVDISQSHLRAYGNESRAWTTRGTLENRNNQNKKGDRGPLLRFRDYRADSIHTVALTLDPAEETPTIEELQHALQFPERPLFIGRKACLPAAPLLFKRIECESLTDALRKAPLSNRADQRDRFPAWWPVEEDKNQLKADMEYPVTDRRDWKNQIHVGERWIAQGEIEIQHEENSNE